MERKEPYEEILKKDKFESEGKKRFWRSMLLRSVVKDFYEQLCKEMNTQNGQT